MKKYLIIVICILFCLSAVWFTACGGGGSQSGPAGSKAKPGKITMDKFSSSFPENTFFYVTIEDIPGQIEEWQNTRLYKLLQERPELKSELDKGRNELDMELQKNLNMSLADVRDLLAGDISFGAWDLNVPEESARFALMIETGEKKAAWEALINEKLIPAVEENMQVKPRPLNVGNYMGNGLDIPFVPLGAYYIFMDDTLVLTGFEESLNDLVAAKDGKGFDKNEKYRNVRGKVSGNLNSVFVDMKKAMEIVGDIAEAEGDAEDVEMLMELGFDTLSVAYGSSTVTEEGSSVAFQMEFDGPRKGIIKALDIPASEPKSIKFAPYNTSVYMAVVAGDLLNIWNNIKELTKAYGTERDIRDMEEGLAAFKAQIGYDLETDVLANLGGEICLTVDQFTDIPSLYNTLLAIEIKDQEKIMEVIKSIVTKNNMRLNTSDYKGKTIYSMPIPMGFFTINMTFTDGFLLVSGNPIQLQSSIDRASAGNGLETAENFKTTLRNIDKNCNFMLYVQPKNAIVGLQTVSQMIPMNQGNLPDFDGMKEYMDGGGFTISNSKDGIVFRAFNSLGIPVGASLIGIIE